MDELRAAMHNNDNVACDERAEQRTPLERLRAMWLDALADSDPMIDQGIDELISCNVVSLGKEAEGIRVRGQYLLSRG